MGQYKNVISISGSSTYNIGEYDEVLNIDLSAIGSDITLNLPSISTSGDNSIGFGWRLLVVDESRTITGGTYNITVNASSGDFIDDDTSYVFNGNDSFSFFIEYVDEGLWTIIGSVNNSGSGGSCIKWLYNTGTTASGITNGEVRFDDSDITATEEIYISVYSDTGPVYWYDYFNKLVNTLCCTLTVSVPGNSNDYIVFDYDSSGSTLESDYLKFVISGQWENPLSEPTSFSSISNGDELCLSFDLFKCENTNTPSGGGGDVSEPCYAYWQYDETSLSAVTSVNDTEINDITFATNNGDGQFTIGTTGGTDTSYTLSVGDQIYVHMSQTNYWGNLANAMNIGSNSQVTLTNWNQNGTSTTGEMIIIETSDIIFNNANNYVVFEGTITEITNGFTGGIGDQRLFCIDVSEIVQPPDPSQSSCEGVFRMGVFTPLGGILISSSGQDQYQVDGEIVSNGLSISSVSGGGIYGALTSDDAYSICTPYNERQFYFAETDYNGNDLSTFFNGLVVGDKLKYEVLYDDTNNNVGDYIVFELVEPVTTNTDGNSQTFYILKSIILLDQSNINSCLGFFSKPNNIVCLSEVSQVALLPPPPGGNEVMYTVESFSPTDRPSVTGTTVIDNSDITSLSGTTLRVTSTDLTGTDNENRLSSTISNVSLNYLGCEITYEVTDQTHYGASGGIPAYEEITLGDIITNGFDSPRGLKYSASTITTGNTMYMRFDTSTGGIVINPGEDRLTTSNGSTNKVVAQPNLKFSGDVLYITAVTQYDTTAFSGDVLQGQIRWNDDWSTFDMGMNENVTQQVGQEQYYYVKNQTGTQIDDGTVVMATGTTGNSGRILVAPAIGDGTIPARYIMGIATQNIGNGEDGFVTSFGLVKGINTEGPGSETWNDGDELWVSPTTPGGLTNIEPTEPNLKVSVALVIHAHSNGSIFVRPTFFGRLGDLQNLQTSGETNGDLVVYNSTTDVWEYTKTLKGDYTISGDTTQYGVLYQKSDEVDNVGTGITAVSYISTGDGESVFFNYVIKEKTNTCMRTGTVMVVSDGVGTQWTDTSTPDINCSTKGVSFDARVSGGNIVLRAIVTQGEWNIRVRNEVIF